MSPESHHQQIEAAITGFAQAYAALEALQQTEGAKEPHAVLLPLKGDQKTGLIGEYWAVRYARALFNDAAVVFGGHSQKGWDLKVQGLSTPPHYIQVKTASEFGNGKLSPIFKPSQRPAGGHEAELPDYWNELWLLWLDRGFQPLVLWKLRPEYVEFGARACLKGKSLRRDPAQPTTGSSCFKWDQAEAVTGIREKLQPA